MAEQRFVSGDRVRFLGENYCSISFYDEAYDFCIREADMEKGDTFTVDYVNHEYGGYMIGFEENYDFLFPEDVFELAD
jgi:hypothetical protein